MKSEVPRVGRFVLLAVEKQLQENEPKEVRLTLERLKEAGFSEEDAKHLIGAAVAAEMRNAVEKSTAFSPERYLELLAKLPDQAEVQR